MSVSFWTMLSSIGHIKTDVIIDTDLKTGILKSYISNYFPIMLAFQIVEIKTCNKFEQHLQNCIFNETSIMSFRLGLREINWYNLKTSNVSNLQSIS